MLRCLALVGAVAALAAAQKGVLLTPELGQALVPVWREAKLRATAVEHRADPLRTAAVLAGPVRKGEPPLLLLLWRQDDQGRTEALLPELFRDPEVAALVSLFRPWRLQVAGVAPLERVYDGALPRFLVFDATGARRAELSMARGRARPRALAAALREVVACGRRRALSRYLKAHRALLNEMAPVAAARERLAAERRRVERAGGDPRERARLARAEQVLTERWEALRAREAQLVAAFFAARE